MEDPLAISLVVTGIGMLVLFLALLFLCGLMYLMTALIKDRPEVEEKGSMGEGGCGSVGADEQRAMRRRVAVIGVALARAELELSSAGLPEIETSPSPWQQYHRQRLLNVNQRTV